MPLIRHGTEAINGIVRGDGDIDAVNYRIQNTGDSSVVAGDRYKHTIHHGLKRIPIGCMVIMTDANIDFYVLEKDKDKIIVKFDTARADITLTIW